MISAYLAQIKLAIAAVAFVGWTWATYYVSTHLERESWVSAENAKKDKAIQDKDASVARSYASGDAYEKKRTEVARRAAPDRSIDELLEGPAGDAVLPGALGLRLNAILAVREAGATASQPAGTVQ